MPLSPAELFAALPPEQQAAALAAAAPNAIAVGPEPTPPALEAVPNPEPITGPVDDGWAELDDFYDDTLPLRFRGREYVLHAADIDLGLQCQRLMGVGLTAASSRSRGAAKKAGEEAADILDDTTEAALYIRLLGGDTKHPNYRAEWDVYEQLRRDGAPWSLVQHMGATAIFWAAFSREMALDFWRTGGRPPKAREPEQPAPRAPQDRKRPATTTAPKGGATSTRKRASSSSTPQKKKPAHKATPGLTS